MTHARRTRRGLTVRSRAALAAALALIPVLAIAWVVGVLTQRHQLTQAASLVAEEQARSVAAEVARTSSATESLPASTLGGEESLVQLVDAAGTVLQATGELDGRAALVPPFADGRAHTRVLPRAVASEEDRAVAVAVPVAGQGRYVVAAQSLESVDAATASTTQLFVVGSLLVIVVVTAMTWVLTGRALRPVETMRSRVDEISGDDISSRLPDPRTGDEIARLATTLNAMLDRLESSAQAQRRFVADASHELRSPISTIRLLHETASIAEHPDGAAGQTREVLVETARLERLVADLLLLARGDAAAAGPSERVDLAGLVRDVASRPRSVPVDLDLTPGLVVTGDPEALSRLVGNLLDNAERHAGSAVSVVLTGRDGADGPEVVLRVRDDGAGVPTADHERIFERFVRLDEGRARDDGGTGLGLAIARQTAGDHRGTLTLDVDAALGDGACFELVLPADPGV
ncbi:HAMP domain-containing sensor histidine kinase [soil metagenome]